MSRTPALLRWFGAIGVAALSLALWNSPLQAEEFPEPTPAEAKFFELHVRPVLAKRCYKCHSEEKQKGGLRLDSLPAMLQGGESGYAAIEPGKPGESLLIEAINYESYEMPPTGKLPEKEIAALTRWVKIGAPWPGANKHGPVEVVQKPKITEEDREFWSFQPVERPALPKVGDPRWQRNPIDRFIYRRLEQEGLQPARPASPRELVRRYYFDLIGLPPGPEEVESFVQAAEQDEEAAIRELVDRLLASPRYGEKWGRHWLDLVRYAESDGFRQDAFRPNAWRYRDYVIRSFNADKPYDQFVAEQLAGDEIAPHDPDALIATGFLRHGIYEYNQRDVRTHWSDILNEVTDVTSDVFLGLGMQCARCHDHKFDPILQKDYYQLQAFLAPAMWRDDIAPVTPAEREKYQQQLQVWKEKTADLRAQIDQIEQPILQRAADRAINKFPEDIQAMIRTEPSKRTPQEHQLAELAYRQVDFEYGRTKIASKLKGEKKEKYEALKKKLAEFDHLKPKPLPKAMLITDVGFGAPQVTIPGGRKSEPISPGFLTVLEEEQPAIAPPEKAEILPRSDGRKGTTGRRAALANWLTDPNHPLTTRVIANRIWQYHFGEGLVSTASDFGHLGEKPSHPELLDWLTREFVENGWSFKKMHRLILTSQTFRQTALRPTPEVAKKVDPSNRLLWRMNTHRLDAEQIRDAMLAVSGELDQRMGGPSQSASSQRRTVYTKFIRNTRDPLLDVFDLPGGFSSTPKRNTTTTPTQALLMINGSWPLERAKAFAKRLQREHPNDPRRQLHLAYQLAFGRSPTEGEQEVGLKFLQQQSKAAENYQEDKLPILAELPGGFGKGAKLASKSLQNRLHVPDHKSLPSGDFTVEAIISLDSLYPDATVRTIVAQWDDNNRHPGWAFGVTSTRSAYDPRNLILQLVGDPKQGGQGYEVIASNLRPELGKTYYVAVSVKLDDTSKQGVTFYLQELGSDKKLQVAHVKHKVTKHYRANVDLTLGGRAGSKRHYWDGTLGEVRLSNRVLSADELLLQSSEVSESTVGHWKFADREQFYLDASGKENHIQPGRGSQSQDAVLTSLTDLCHVLLNSNEFLYVD